MPGIVTNAASGHLGTMHGMPAEIRLYNSGYLPSVHDWDPVDIDEWEIDTTDAPGYAPCPVDLLWDYTTAQLSAKPVPGRLDISFDVDGAPDIRHAALLVDLGGMIWVAAIQSFDEPQEGTPHFEPYGPVPAGTTTVIAQVVASSGIEQIRPGPGVNVNNDIPHAPQVSIDPSIASLAPTEWEPVPAETGWTYPIQPRIRYSAGQIEIGAFVANSTGAGISDPIFTLPPGYDPPTNQFLVPVITMNNAGDLLASVVTVDTTGTARLTAGHTDAVSFLAPITWGGV